MRFCRSVLFVEIAETPVHSPAQFPLRVVFFSLSLHDERLACSRVFSSMFMGAMDFDVLRNAIFRSVYATYSLIAIM